MSLDLAEFSSLQSRYLENKQLPHPLDMLTRLGNFYELDFLEVPAAVIEQELKALESQWVQYNPYKPNVPRKALSITSLDGGTSGKPDLYSLREFFQREGTLYKESDFRTLTPHYHALPSLKPIIDHFLPHLGRSHVIQFNTGGYFPPHRDGAAMLEPDTFRILVPLTKVSRSGFIFMHGDKRLQLELGVAYYLNTLIEHSVFSFTDNATILVLNVMLNHESVKLVKSRLMQR